MADVEAPEASPLEASPAELAAEGPLVLVEWLTFFVGHATAIACITIASVWYWQIGFTFSLLYLIADVVLAFALERRARHRYKVFVNLMWIIICLCVLVCGTFLSVYVIGKWEEDSGWAPTAPDQLADLLPSNDTSLRSQGVWPTSWANGAKSVADDEFTSLGDQLFFSAAEGKGRRALWRSNSSKPATLVAPGMLDAHSFTFVGPDVFFFAKDYETFRNPGVECLWMIAAARPASGATLVKEFESGTQLLSMFVDILSSTPLFYFKVYRRCSGLWGYTLFQSSGNTSGTVDLDASANCDVTPVGREWPYARPPTTRLASELFLAVVSQTILAFVILVWKKLPGMFLNLFGGFFAMAILVWMIRVDELSDISLFMKVGLTSYSSVMYLFLLLLGSPKSPKDAWLGELHTWGTGVTAVTFFAIIHYDLDIPYSSIPWQWVVYSLLLPLQMLLSLLLRNKLPMACGGIGCLIACYKVSDVIVEALFASLSSEVKWLLLLAILAPLSASVVLIAMLSVDLREKPGADLQRLVYGVLEDDEVEAVAFKGSQDELEKCRGPADAAAGSRMSSPMEVRPQSGQPPTLPHHVVDKLEGCGGQLQATAVASQQEAEVVTFVPPGRGDSHNSIAVFDSENQTFEHGKCRSCGNTGIDFMGQPCSCNVASKYQVAPAAEDSDDESV